MADNENSKFGYLFQKIGNNIKVIAIAAVVLIILFNTFFQVGAEEVGVVTRLGKYNRTLESGLNYKIFFIEEVYKVPVERQQKQEFGFRTTSVGVQSTFSKRGAEGESLMLTGDLNLADVEWVVQYRIDKPYNYLFKVRDPDNTLRDITEAGMRQIVGDRTVNEILTVGRSEISGRLKTLIQDLSNEYELGIRVEQVVLQDVTPPETVKPAFNAVNEAQQEKETLINQARSEYNKVIPKARGQAEETIQKAEGYATERVNNSRGEATRFNALYSEYIKAPEVTKSRIYLETMQEVVPKLGDRIIMDEEGNNLLPLLQVNPASSK
jgi:modulator of FtsH protease HflK